MPRINYDNMPYKKKISRRERADENGYFFPNPDFKEDRRTYREFHTYDSLGHKLEHLFSFDDEGRIIRTAQH